MQPQAVPVRRWSAARGRLQQVPAVASLLQALQQVPAAASLLQALPCLAAAASAAPRWLASSPKGFPHDRPPGSFGPKTMLQGAPAEPKQTFAKDPSEVPPRCPRSLAGPPRRKRLPALQVAGLVERLRTSRSSPGRSCPRQRPSAVASAPAWSRSRPGCRRGT